MIIRWRIIAIFTLFCVFSLSPIFAQDSDSSNTSPADSESETTSNDEYSDTWYYGATIKSVNFKGLKSVNNKEVEGIVSGFYGKKFSDELFADI